MHGIRLHFYTSPWEWKRNCHLSDIYIVVCVAVCLTVRGLHDIKDKTTWTCPMRPYPANRGCGPVRTKDRNDRIQMPDGDRKQGGFS